MYSRTGVFQTISRFVFDVRFWVVLFLKPDLPQSGLLMKPRSWEKVFLVACFDCLGSFVGLGERVSVLLFFVLVVVAVLVWNSLQGIFSFLSLRFGVCML